MNVSWDNLGKQTEKNALVFLKAANLSDSAVDSDGDKIRSSLLGCYEHFSSSQLIQAKVFELLAVVLRKSKKRLFDEENLVLGMRYAKAMMSEWISSSEVIQNVLKFLIVVFEKEKPGSVDEAIIAQCGEVLKTHSHSNAVQKICLTFICGVSRYCDIESFSDKSISDLALPVVETVRCSKDDLDVVIKAIVVLTFLFERVPERLHGASMDALDAVSGCLQRLADSPAFAAMAVAFLQICAVEDTHFIILSSSDKGFGLYCDLCLKFLEHNDVASLLSCVLLLKRACSEKIQELTINSVPGLKKRIVAAVGQVRDTAAASSIDAAPVAEQLLHQIVFASDGVLGALDSSYCPDSGLDTSYSAKGKGTLPRASSSINESSGGKPPKILPRSNSLPSFVPPKPPAAAEELDKPLSSVSLLLHANSIPIHSGKKIKAKRRNHKATEVETEEASELSDVSSTPRALSVAGSLDGGWPRSPASQISPANQKGHSSNRVFTFSQVMQEEAKKVSTEEAGPDVIKSELSDSDVEITLPPLPYKRSPGTVSSLAINALLGPSAQIDSLPVAAKVVKTDSIVDKMKTFQTALSASTSPRNDKSTSYNINSGILRSNSSGEETEQSIDVKDSESQARPDNTNSKELENNEQVESVTGDRDNLIVQMSNKATEKDASGADYNYLLERCKKLQTTLDNSVCTAASIAENFAAERYSLCRDRDEALAELCALRSSTLHGVSVDETNCDATLREIESLKKINAELKSGIDHARDAAKETASQHNIQVDMLRQKHVENEALVEELQVKLSEATSAQESHQHRILQLQALVSKSQEQASVAVLRVEELHSVLMEATSKIELLNLERDKLRGDLQDALAREEALVKEQEDLIDAYREDGNDNGNNSVVLISDEGDKIVVPIREVGVQDAECGDIYGDEDQQMQETMNEPTEFDDDYRDENVRGYYEEEDSSFYHDQSNRSLKPKKTPVHSASQGIKSALNYLNTVPSFPDDSGDNADFIALIEDLAALIQQYFQAMVQCPTSDPTKSINHTLRSNDLCAALCAPRLGLVDNKKLMRCDVEISIRRQKGVRLFTVYGVAFTLVLCIYKKHKLDTNDNDSQTLLFRLIEMLSAYLEKEDENENLWIHNSINQRQGLSSPTRLKSSGNVEDDEVNDDQFTPDDLMAASRLLHKETKSLQSIFDCYPSYASTARSSRVPKNSGVVSGRSLDTVILIAKDFGICPALLDRTGCINIIGQEIRRSQNDPDWVFPAGDILVSFSQFEIFLMNVALRNKNFGSSNGFVTAIQKLAGLLWWMDNSGGKERLRDKDRNFKVCPFRVHGLIPMVKAKPKGEDFWLEK